MARKTLNKLRIAIDPAMLEALIKMLGDFFVDRGVTLKSFQRIAMVKFIESLSTTNEKSGKIKLRHAKLTDDKSLPPFWQRIYCMELRRLRTYYKKFVKIDNPIYSILFEKVSYIAVKLRYIESEDFLYENDVDMEDPAFLKEYNNLISVLNKTMDQIMKYTEVSKKAVRKEELKFSINAKSMKKDELDEAISEFLGGGKAGFLKPLERKEITGDKGNGSTVGP
jgi:hypothetical protein